MDALLYALTQLPELDVWSAGGVLTALAVLWWGLLLLRGMRDQHMRIIVCLVGLVAAYQGLQLAFEPRGWNWIANAVGVICCVGAMAMMERVVQKQHNSELALRLAEAREMPAQSPQRFEVSLSVSQPKLDIPATILESAPMAMFAVGLDGSVNFWNSAAERLLGWKSEEVIGNRMPNLISSSGGGVFEEGAIKLIRKDGAPVEGPVRSVPVRDSYGAVSGILTIVSPVPSLEQLS